MSEFDGGASAPADSAPVSAPEAEVATPPNPVSSETPLAPEPKAPEPKKPVSLDDALDRAAAKVEAKEKADAKAEKTEPKAPVKADADKTPAKADPKATEAKDDGPARDETGKFASKTPAGDDAEAADATKAVDATDQASKDASPAHEPPARFTPEAKAAWKDAPEHVKAETHRAITELTQGIEKHRDAAKKYETIKEFDDLAEQHGTNLKAALGNYVGIERVLRQDPVRGIEQIAQNLGIDAHEIAAKILGRTPEQHTEAVGAQIRELSAKADHHYQIAQSLHAENVSLKEMVASFQNKEIETFKSSADRFDELLPTMLRVIQGGLADNLPEAYQMASTLKPGAASASKPNPAPETPAKVTSDPVAQTLKGTKSITGAPSTGSTPAKRQPSPSIDDALNKAFANAG